MAILLASVQRIKDNTYLDNNVDDKTIKITLERAQELMLEPVLGTALYEKIMGGIRDGNLELAYQNLMPNYIWPILYRATSYLIANNLVMRYVNDGVVKDSNENSTSVTISELNILRRNEKESYDYQVAKFQRYMSQNSAQYPEYYQVADDGIASSGDTYPPNFYYDENI